MQDLANNIGYVVVGVALLLLSAAVALRSRLAGPDDGADAPALNDGADAIAPDDAGDRAAALAGSSASAADQPDAEVQLTRGWHDIRVRFVDTADFSYITLLWQPPGRARAVIPPAALRPWPAARVPVARPEDALAP